MDRLLHAGACAVYAATLKEPPMRVQAAVVEAIASFAHHSKICQDLFAQNNSARYLVSHLATGTIESGRGGPNRAEEVWNRFEFWHPDLGKLEKISPAL